MFSLKIANFALSGQVEKAFLRKLVGTHQTGTLTRTYLHALQPLIVFLSSSLTTASLTKLY